MRRGRAGDATLSGLRELMGRVTQGSREDAATLG